MTRKGILLTMALVVLAALYVIFFTDWFRTRSIQIFHQVRAGGRATRMQGDANSTPGLPVSFSFNGKYRLDRVKVVLAADLATNRFAHPLWHLIATDRSPPIKSLIYGKTPNGMKPSVPGAEAEPLEPDVNYVIMIEADGGSIKAQTNFITRAAPPPVRR